MRITLVAALIAALSLSCSAFAQQPAPAQKPAGASSAGATLPPDIDPVSLTRLPPLKRADLDDEGKAIYDKIVGEKPPPATGPVPMSLYSPKIAAPINELNGFLRYNGDLSPRHTEVAICVATWEIEQQYEYSSHEPAALRLGAPQEVIDTIKYNREPKGLSPEETLIIKLGARPHAQAQSRLGSLRASREALRQEGRRRARDRDGRLRDGRHGAHDDRPTSAAGPSGTLAAALAPPLQSVSCDRRARRRCRFAARRPRNDRDDRRT